MTVCVGVDGGQSGLRLAVAGTDLVADATGFSFAASDPYGEQLEAITSCWEEVGRPGPVDVVALGLTGAPSPGAERERFAASVAGILDATEVRLGADMVTAHAGALPDAHGVVLTAGTGVACLAVDRERDLVHRVDAWGYLFGDDGSSFAVGRAGIAAVLRAQDGRGPATSLTAAATRRYGPAEQLTHRLYTSRTAVADIAAFAVDVDSAAGEDDPVAAAIVEGAAGELVHTVETAAEAVRAGDRVPVAGTGRWFAAPFLHRAFVERLQRASRRCLVPAAGSGLDGACRLAAAPDTGPYAALMLTHRAGP
ncbi:MAG: N-acetylglucosamine kinase [Streptosporangiales bacterium]